MDNSSHAQQEKRVSSLNSTGKCSNIVLAMITTLVRFQHYIKQHIVVITYVLHMNFTFLFERAEITKDTTEVNSLIHTEHPNVSSWPIREYKMQLQDDGYVQKLNLYALL